MNLPRTGTVQAKPVTPQPPSSARRAPIGDRPARVVGEVDLRTASASRRSAIVAHLGHRRSSSLRLVADVAQHVAAAAQLADGAHAQARQHLHHLLAPGVLQVDQPLGGPLEAHLHHQFGIGGGDAARATAAALAAGAAHAAQRDHLGRADDHAVGAQGDGLQQRRRPCGCRRERSA